MKEKTGYSDVFCFGVISCLRPTYEVSKVTEQELVL